MLACGAIPALRAFWGCCGGWGAECDQDTVPWAQHNSTDAVHHGDVRSHEEGDEQLRTVPAVQHVARPDTNEQATQTQAAPATARPTEDDVRTPRDVGDGADDSQTVPRPPVMPDLKQALAERHEHDARQLRDLQQQAEALQADKDALRAQLRAADDTAMRTGAVLRDAMSRLKHTAAELHQERARALEAHTHQAALEAEVAALQAELLRWKKARAKAHKGNGAGNKAAAPSLGCRESPLFDPGWQALTDIVNFGRVPPCVPRVPLEAVRKVGDAPLGAGSEGTVWRCTVTMPDGRTVDAALKEPATDDEAAGHEQVCAEAEATWWASGHPGTCTLLGVVVLPNQSHTTSIGQMDQALGTLTALVPDALPMDAFLRRWRGRLEARDVVDLSRQVAGVVGWLQRHNRLHCDLKPSNILVAERRAAARGAGPRFAVKVIDLTGSVELGEKGKLAIADEDDLPVMTPQYAAPEVARRYLGPEEKWGAVPDVTAQADVFGLGAVMWAAANGGDGPFDALPEEAVKQMHAEHSALPLARLTPRRCATPGMPPAWCALVNRCLEQGSPAARPTIDDVLHLLDELALELA